MSKKIPITKAETLDSLQNKLEKFVVPKLEYFTVYQWRNGADDILNQIQESFSSSRIAVRSSALEEDGVDASHAGAYLSILDISVDSVCDLRSAIDNVVAAYDQKNQSGSSIDDNQVLIQEYVAGTLMSGVIFTHDLNTGAPYYVINYDDVTGSTSSVTSGIGDHSNRTLFVYRDASAEIRSPRFKAVVDAVKELEVRLDNQMLDIEFVMTESLVPYLLQVRPITTQPNWHPELSKRIKPALNKIKRTLHDRFRPVSGVHGRTTVFGQMPDWNPAEMIGRAPRLLALSMYETLITDRAWSIARARMGYQVPGERPLMLRLGGQPFVDTRLSFNSFLPKGLPISVSEKLVNSWVYNLGAHPELHDKVEFEVAITSYRFDLKAQCEERLASVLGENEVSTFKQALLEQFRNLVTKGHVGGISQAKHAIRKLEVAQAVAQCNEAGLLEAAAFKREIEETIEYGTAPFAILARHAFIAKGILSSFVNSGVASPKEIDQFQSGIKTVAGELVESMRGVADGTISDVEFMRRFGHLRPGTYDILAKRYDETLHLSALGGASVTEPDGPGFEFTHSQCLEMERILEADGLAEVSGTALLDYIQEAIAGREYAKFVFTRSVSNIIERIIKLGKRHGISREKLSHLSLGDIEKSLTLPESAIGDTLRNRSQLSAKENKITTAIRLPQVLFDQEGVSVIPFQVSQPNFITQKTVSAESRVLQTGYDYNEIENKIILIENADPGFDWIFSQSISGLITKYGGANSHMAIRCAEFGLPAAIGCGEQYFEAAIKAKWIVLDCSAGLMHFA